MASKEVKTFWERLQWSAPVTMLIVVMPGSLALLHFALRRLSLTSNTLILLLVTVIYSLG